LRFEDARIVEMDRRKMKRDYSQPPTKGQIARSREAIAVRNQVALITIKLPRFSAPLRMKIVRGADGRVAYLHNRLRALKRSP